MERFHFFTMGACCSTDPGVIEIGPKTIRQSQMKKIKTYEDAMRAIGIELKINESIRVNMPDFILLAHGYDRFQIAESYTIRGATLPAKALYRKRK